MAQAKQATVWSHPEEPMERARLEETITYVKSSLALLYDKRLRFDQELKDSYKHLDPTDSSFAYSTIMFNAQMLDAMGEQLEQLIAAQKKPYFARIDVKHHDKSVYDKLYLGKVSLFDESMENPLVVDWRAPVASLYYDGRLGEAQYTVEEEKVTVDLALKRQYTIENGILKHFMDVDISTSDEFLQAALGQHAGDKLKDIVSTIQAEQNVIIRSDIHKPLIVQGVAGSGKTTIALHRIAYLIYTYAKSFKPKDFMIIAPNTLFLDYISQVLPELGAEAVNQVTYVDLMQRWIGKRHSLTKNHLKLVTLIAKGEHSPEALELSRVAAFKNNMGMKALLDQQLAEIEANMLPEGDVFLDNLPLVSADTLKAYYWEHYTYLPYKKRIDAIARNLKKKAKEVAKEAVKTIRERVGLRIEGILTNTPPSEERREKVVSLMDRREARIAQIQAAEKHVVKDFLARVPKVSAEVVYTELMSSPQRLEAYGIDLELARVVASHATALAAKKQLEQEDLAPLVYLKAHIDGIEDTEMKYVVIDEAQDFGLFQFYVLKHLLKTERFTILGDMAQGIHSYRALPSWNALMAEVFTQRCVYLTLEQSYRTTVEIMDAANQVLLGSELGVHIKDNAKDDPMALTLARPVVRYGPQPEVVHHDNEKALLRGVGDALEWLKSEEYTTVAVIAKTPEEAQWLYKHLKPRIGEALMLVDDQSEHFNHAFLVLPSHLAKGLEFDAVLVVELKSPYGPGALEAKLKYVAMTRAMHWLAVHRLADAG